MGHISRDIDVYILSSQLFRLVTPGNSSHVMHRSDRFLIRYATVTMTITNWSQIIAAIHKQENSDLFLK